MSELDRILRLAGLATEQSVAAPADRELKEQDGCPCCGGGRCKCSGDCPDCNCHGNNDEWDESVNEADSEGTYAVVTYNYSENWASIDLYKDGEQVERWNDYFHSNETGNPLTAKIAELAQAHGIDPEGLKLVDGEDQQTGVFSGGDIHWDKPEQADEAAKPDFRDVDGDGDREESWKDAEEDKEEMEESEVDDRDELTKKLFPRRSREDMEKADQERNRAMNQKRFMKPGKPSRSGEWGVYEGDFDEGKDEIEESAWCGVCGNDTCTCTDVVSEAPTMDTTQLVIMMRNAGLSEEVISQKLDEWANTPEGVGEVEPTAHGDAYDFAQSVNLSLKRYLDAQDMKVQVTEHKVEDMKALYEAHKAKK